MNLFRSERGKSTNHKFNQRALLVIVLACFALSPTAQAAGGLKPPPDGGYAGFNTAEGDDALFNLTSGIENTATGFDALFSNTAGSNNTANGFEALFTNTTGVENTATGFDALFSNTAGSFNTATGDTALFSNTTGGDNTANGFEALFNNTTAGANTATGFQALFSNTTGSNNTANGFEALFSNTTGSGNIALGENAGANLTTGNNNIDIGNGGVRGDDSTIRVGDPAAQTHNTFIAGIFGAIIPRSAEVVIDASGHLGTTGAVSSSARFKDEIKPMGKASEAILALKPVTFRYKKEIDPEHTPQFGLVAEEVERVNPALVTRDATGQVYTVRYDAVNAMLLNEFLKEHRKVEKQERRLEQQEATITKQQKQIEALTAGLQKVSAQLEVSNPAPQIVVNNQ